MHIMIVENEILGKAEVYLWGPTYKPRVIGNSVVRSAGVQSKLLFHSSVKISVKTLFFDSPWLYNPHFYTSHPQWP